MTSKQHTVNSKQQESSKEIHASSGCLLIADCCLLQD
jgi:hypothetical protein